MEVSKQNICMADVTGDFWYLLGRYPAGVYLWTCWDQPALWESFRWHSMLNWFQGEHWHFKMALEARKADIVCAFSPYSKAYLRPRSRAVLKKKPKPSSFQHVSEFGEGGQYVSLKWIISMKQACVSRLSREWYNTLIADEGNFSVSL